MTNGADAYAFDGNGNAVPITVDAACCAGVTPDSHAAALKTMQMCQIDIAGE